MKMLFALALLGAALPVSAHPVLLSRSSTAPTGFIAVYDTPADRNTYNQRAHDDVHEWEQKLRDFNVTVKAEGKDADQAAKADLKKAWDKTEIASRKLQTSGEESWDAAKAEYEKASQDLADTWHRIQAEHS